MPDGFVDSWNEEFLKYSGLSSAEVRGVGCRAMMPAQDVPESHSRFNNAVKNGIAYEAIVRLKSEEGSLNRHLIRVEPLKTADGAILRWLGSAANIEQPIYVS